MSRRVHDAVARGYNSGEGIIAAKNKIVGQALRERWVKRDDELRVADLGVGDGALLEQMRAMQQRFNRARNRFMQSTHTDLTTGKSVQMTTVTVDSTKKEYYQTELPATRPADWKVTGKTKSILGYNCQRATCTIKDQPCTVWFTTDLPYTYSPAPNFTPDKGVVLVIESDDLLYRATKISAGAVNEASLKPHADAKLVTEAEMRDIRQKATANMRQQMNRDFPVRN